MENSEEEVEEEDERNLHPEFEAPEEDAGSPRGASFWLGHSDSLRLFGMMPPRDAYTY